MDFKLPDIGEGIAEGEIVKWLVKEGETVKEDQPIFEVMTDKATVEIPSPRAGVIKKILAQEGQVVPVETVVLIIDDGTPSSGEKTVKTEEVKENTGFILVEPKIKKVLATPATRKFARDNNVDITTVKATGNNGKVTKEDIIAHLSKNKVETKELIVVKTEKYNNYNENETSEKTTLNEERVPLEHYVKKSLKILFVQNTMHPISC